MIHIRVVRTTSFTINSDGYLNEVFFPPILSDCLLLLFVRRRVDFSCLGKFSFTFWGSIAQTASTLEFLLALQLIMKSGDFLHTHSVCFSLAKWFHCLWLSQSAWVVGFGSFWYYHGRDRLVGNKFRTASHKINLSVLMPRLQISWFRQNNKNAILSSVLRKVGLIFTVH